MMPRVQLVRCPDCREALARAERAEAALAIVGAALTELREQLAEQFDRDEDPDE